MNDDRPVWDATGRKMTRQWLTLNDVRKVLGKDSPNPDKTMVSRTYVLTLVKEGRLPFYMTPYGRLFYVADVAEFLRQRRLR